MPLQSVLKRDHVPRVEETTRDLGERAIRVRRLHGQQDGTQRRGEVPRQIGRHVGHGLPMAGDLQPGAIDRLHMRFIGVHETDFVTGLGERSPDDGGNGTCAEDGEAAHGATACCG